jgi:hypothetical protein
VNRARVVVRENGCSNLVDERPKPADFGLWRFERIQYTDEKRTLYRYRITAEDLSDIVVSPVPIKIRGSEILFYRTGTSMYLIDDDGFMQELYHEGDFVSPPRSKK